MRTRPCDLVRAWVRSMGRRAGSGLCAAFSQGTKSLTAKDLRELRALLAVSSQENWPVGREVQDGPSSSNRTTRTIARPNSSLSTYAISPSGPNAAGMRTPFCGQRAHVTAVGAKDVGWSVGTAVAGRTRDPDAALRVDGHRTDDGDPRTW